MGIVRTEGTAFAIDLDAPIIARTSAEDENFPRRARAREQRTEKCAPRLVFRAPYFASPLISFEQQVANKEFRGANR